MTPKNDDVMPKERHPVPPGPLDFCSLYKGEDTTLNMWTEVDTLVKERIDGTNEPKIYRTGYAENSRFSGERRAKTALTKAYKDYQRKKGFYLTRAAAIAGINAIDSCLLLSKWKEYVEKIRWPWIASPKVDGLRARWTGKELLTRGGIPFKGLEHITRHLPDSPLDGELYVPGLSLQKIQSYIMGSNKVKTNAQFILFDIPVKGVPYSVRLSSLAKMEFKVAWIVHMPFKICKSREEADEYYKWCLENDFEGTVYRNPNGLYECRRVNDTLKRKPVIEEEFEIIEVLWDKDNLVYFRLRCEDDSFKCVPEWDDDERTIDAQTAQIKFMNRWATVQFQDRTDKGLPKFANVKAIRFTAGGKVLV